MRWLTSSRAFRRLRRTWPYVLVEVLVPGGTVVAVLLWLSSGQAKGQFSESLSVPASRVAVEREVGSEIAFDRPQAARPTELC